MRIDGSKGEGGGQILRTSLALSALKGERLVVENVRAGREPSGLKPQHLAALRALVALTDASVEGDKIGSERAVFEPDEPSGGEYTVDVGTAGATTLVAHAVLPTALNADGDVVFRIRGGTHVQWSPTLEHLSDVILPILRNAGADVSAELVRRGHYPQGGGEIVLRVSPSAVSTVEPRRGKLERVTGISHTCDPPEHIVKRQVSSAREALDVGKDVPIDIDEVHVEEAPSKGTAVTLVAQTDTGKKEGLRTRLGGTALGERGKPAEEVGREAAEELNEALDSGADVDKYTADQLVPYVAIGGGSYTAPEVTSHLSTNVDTVSRFYEVSVENKRVSGK